MAAYIVADAMHAARITARILLACLQAPVFAVLLLCSALLACLEVLAEKVEP